MEKRICDACGAKMKRNGTTPAGAQRWRCKNCGASYSHRIDNSAKELKVFLSWLMSKDAIADLPVSRATFWRRMRKFWEIWPIPEFTGEVYDVLFMDGIWISKDLVVLIARTKEYVVGWYLAESECTQSWAALMSKIPAPVLVVSDGSQGFAKAVHVMWPTTKIQRCLVHVARHIKRYTTLNPKLDCGRELLEVTRKLTKVKDADAAALWMADYSNWHDRWEKFLREFTMNEGKKLYTHERLRSARRSLNRLVKAKTLFAFVELQEGTGHSWPSTNNVIEGSNALIRRMLDHHRGMGKLHRVKAVFWWCYMHTETPRSAPEILKMMPTDSEIDDLFSAAAKRNIRKDGAPEEFGSGVVWNEFHSATEFRQ